MTTMKPPASRSKQTQATTKLEMPEHLLLELQLCASHRGIDVLEFLTDMVDGYLSSCDVTAQSMAEDAVETFLRGRAAYPATEVLHWDRARKSESAGS